MRFEDASRRPADAIVAAAIDEDAADIDTGKKIDYLRAVVELALERQDLGPAFREIIAEIAEREGLVS